MLTISNADEKLSYPLAQILDYARHPMFFCVVIGIFLLIQNVDPFLEKDIKGNVISN